jgi:ribosomal RNA-processing protein 9
MKTMCLFVFQTGTVNSLQFSADGKLLVAGVGREHKLGRWWNIKQATNSLVIIRLKKALRKLV